MMNSAPRLPRGNQTGYVLLLIMLVLVAGGATFFSGAYTTTRDASGRYATHSFMTLDNAESALKIYSMTDQDRPGSLPCPDFTGDGTTDINCLNSPTKIHVQRLPWRTLDIGSDADDLWYVMAREFRDHPDAQPINAEVKGPLIIEKGEGAEATGFAALIIDPGDPLEDQENRGSASEEVADYLDIDENTDADNRFIDCYSREDCNDRIIGITTNELFRLIQPRVMDAVKEPIQEFIDDALSDQGYLPYAAKLESQECEPGLERGQLPRIKGDCGSSKFFDPDDFPEWVVDNAWLDIVIYHVDGSCTAMPCTKGNLEVDGDQNLTVVIALAGVPLSDQKRNTSEVVIDDYLESGIADGVYVNKAKSDSNNDIYWGLSP